MNQYHVYILSNSSRRLYTGVTNDLHYRASQHRAGEGGDFTRRYHCHKLVWYSVFTNPRDAIGAEKKIKGWSRAKKIVLIDAMNPAWADLVPSDESANATSEREAT